MRKCAWILHKRITNCELRNTNVNCESVDLTPTPSSLSLCPACKLVKIPAEQQQQLRQTDTAAVKRICCTQIIFKHKNCNSRGSGEERGSRGRAQRGHRQRGSYASNGGSWHPLPMAKMYFSHFRGVHKIFLRFPPHPAGQCHASNGAVHTVGKPAQHEI